MFFSLHTVQSDQLRRAVFLDRDGTINLEKTYLHRIEDWEWISGAQESIKRMALAGYLVVVVSNQAGIARGFYSSDDVENLHRHVQKELECFGCKIDAFFCCPHHPDFTGACKCRKPQPFMLRKAANRLNIDLTRSWMVGDKMIDVQAGQAAGARSILVMTGYGGTEATKSSASFGIANSIVEATENICMADLDCAVTDSHGFGN